MCTKSRARIQVHKIVMVHVTGQKNLMKEQLKEQLFKVLTDRLMVPFRDRAKRSKKENTPDVASDAETQNINLAADLVQNKPAHTYIHIHAHTCTCMHMHAHTYT